ncbi:hypothetical protein P691DRAFT_759959 [Macrolepiota fuliginosa MF-IS2]|uniref:CFEM domain-containing protein n=1 Tax=Macrolepiota fuliginosa MF-IS2 TaxID=1400762 RepID=A0A9P5XCA3_9AGAR|nr:hypothetical protein P691DRAFT_759959 [Macrolepiota fuliginosa MF-IS2]
MQLGFAVAILFLIIGLTCAQSAISTVADTPASTSTTTQTMPPCVFGCLAQATRSSGCTTGDKTCACTNPLFQQASHSCVEFQCNPNEQAIAVAFQQKHGLATPTTVHSVPVATSNVAIAGGRNIIWVGAAGLFGLVVAL